MDRRTPFMVLPLAALAVSPAGYAVQYLSVEQAQAIMFPDTILTAAPLTLTDAQKREIEQRSGMKVRQTTLKRWRAANGGYFVLDQVLGKHEFITYAVALDSTGAVRQVEILDFRETHGDEVRRAAWRNQFTGKTSRDTLRINKDIENISGATLSCVHITDGIRRLLITHDVVIRQP